MSQFHLRPRLHTFFHYSTVVSMDALKRACEKYRLCPPSATCKSFPCVHSSFSTDEDYLLDVQDYVKNPDHRSQVWSHFHNRDNLSPEVLGKFNEDLDRCQRITDKRRQIKEEIATNLEIYLEEAWGRPRRSLTKKEGQASEKANIEIWNRAWRNAEEKTGEK